VWTQAKVISKSIERDESNSPQLILILEANNPTENIRCSLWPLLRNEYDSVRLNQTVVINGICRGLDNGVVIFDSASVEINPIVSNTRDWIFLTTERVIHKLRVNKD
jgi:hypothetical protein